MSPTRPLSPCSKNGCSQLVPAGQRFCEKHQKAETRRYDKDRGTSTERGYDAAWQRTRAFKANMSPLCEICLQSGDIVPLDIVHHIKPIETHPELRLVLDNLLSVCSRHHEEIHKDERWGRVSKKNRASWGDKRNNNLGQLPLFNVC